MSGGLAGFSIVCFLVAASGGAPEGSPLTQQRRIARSATSSEVRLSVGASGGLLGVRDEASSLIQHHRVSSTATSSRVVRLHEHAGAPQPELVIVVPFAHKQVPNLKANLNLWSSMPACRPGEPLADLSFVGSVHESDLSVAKDLLEGVPHASFIGCFRRITYVLSDLKPENDRYPFAPNWVFFWMMLHSGFAQGGYKYIMQHELDVHPIAEMWLNTLISAATYYTSGNSSQPWVIGAGKPEQSAFTGGRRAHVMNGNAIYVNDPEFLRFLRRFHEHFSCTEPAYDTSMGAFLVKESLDPDLHFIITPRFVNCDMESLERCAQRGTDRNPSNPWLPITSETLLVHVKGVTKANWAYFRSLAPKAPAGPIGPSIEQAPTGRSFSGQFNTSVH